MEERNTPLQTLSNEDKDEALNTLDEITKGMTFKQKSEVLKALRTGRIRIMSQEEIDELKAKGAEGVQAVPLKSNARGTNKTKSSNTPQKKASRRKNRSSSRARAKNRK